MRRKPHRGIARCSFRCLSRKRAEESYQKFENMMDMNEDIKMKFAEVPNAVKRTYTFRQ